MLFFGTVLAAPSKQHCNKCFSCFFNCLTNVQVDVLKGKLFRPKIAAAFFLVYNNGNYLPKNIAVKLLRRMESEISDDYEPPHPTD